MIKKSVHIEYSPGSCWRRVLDARVLEEYFSRNGYKIEEDPARTEENILVTCAFIEKTETIALREIERFLKYRGRLTVVGCLIGINPKKLKNIYLGPAINTADLKNIDRLFPRFKIKFKDIKDANKLLEMKISTKLSAPLKKILAYYFFNFWRSVTFHQKFYRDFVKLFRAKMATSGKVYYIRISWGCNNRCAYCVEWKAVGRHYSKKPAICLDEFRAGLKMGFSKFALVADDPGAFGNDRKTSLPKLINQMIQESPEKVSFIIDGLHPKWMLKDLTEWKKVFQTGRIRYAMIPLQSGDDQVLKKMKRGYSGKDFIKTMQMIKKADPRSVVITQAIVGFPTETERAFTNTLRVIQKSGILNAVLFPYCVRDGTVAAKLEPKVPNEIIAKRIEEGKKFLGKNGIFYFHFEVDV